MPAFIRVEVDGNSLFDQYVFPEEFARFPAVDPNTQRIGTLGVFCAIHDSQTIIFRWDETIPSDTELDAEEFIDLIKRAQSADVVKNMQTCVLPFGLEDGDLADLVVEHFVSMTQD